MTYHGSYGRFVCNSCLRNEYAKTFPIGWVWIKAGIGKDVQHACQSCKDQCLKQYPDRVRQGGQKN